MKFDLTEEQIHIKNAVKEFCEKEFKPEMALELDKKEEYPLDLYKAAAKLGFTSMALPEEFGGQGCGLVETCLVVEEMCRGDSSLGVAIMSGIFGGEFILNHGSKEQKEKYLPPLCKGDFIGAAAFTEPNLSGSDINRMETTATKYGNEWWINGQKTFITNATLADFVVVLVQTDSKIRPTHRGETLFVVDKGTPGLEATKLHNKMGIRASTTGELNFDNVKVTDWNIVGELNKGFYYSMEFFDVTRVGVAAQAVGMAQGAWEIAFKYAKQREAFGAPIIQHEAIGMTLAEMATKIEAARLLTYKAATLVDEKKLDAMATAMAKYYAGHVAMEVTNAAIQTMGGYGYFGEYRVEKYHRDAKITEIYEGTSEIQRLQVLKYLLSKY
jgi:alkylation response protein AidB-like acyl-CoA dehydrogenase